MKKTVITYDRGTCTIKLGRKVKKMKMDALTAKWLDAFFAKLFYEK